VSEPSKRPPAIRDFRPFIICSVLNYEATTAFYSDLGFEKLWDDGESACEFATGFASQRFLVTLHHGPEFEAKPSYPGMLHFWVEDAQAWYEYMTELKLEDRYPGVVITPPVVVNWGWRITYVTDPSGLKLHFAEPHSEGSKSFFDDAPWMA
jgi:catechol 2,3-dioxygenase-like lactoylglutathione lyase family enzyme